MKKSILVIEDDESKRAQICSVITQTFESIEMFSAKSYQSGLKELIRRSFDLVVLDMTMPTFDRSQSEPGGRVRPFAGRDILEQVDRRRIRCRAVVVTGFEILGEGESEKTLSALSTELAARFPQIYCGSIHYNPAVNEWESELIQTIQKEFRSE